MRRSTAALGSAVFFALAPGVVAGVVPWWLTRWRIGDGSGFWLVVRVFGVALMAAGVTVLVSGFWRFVREGRGTPAPIAPTEHLVVGGLYRHVRNPMYVAVLATILGQALVFQSSQLLFYAGAAFLFFASFVRMYEEPTLARQYGEGYDRYRRAVPGWWPRWRGWTDDEDGRHALK